jgi:ABC-type lipoprotein export system ATPase subunit
MSAPCICSRRSGLGPTGNGCRYLSGGEQQRVAVRALANNPSVIRPMSPRKSDSKTGGAPSSCPNEFTGRTKSVAPVTHNPDIAKRAIDSRDGGWIDRGQSSARQPMNFQTLDIKEGRPKPPGAAGRSGAV